MQLTSASWSNFLCSDTEVAVTNVTYRTEIGSLPLLMFNMTDLWGFMEVTRLRNGTKEVVECSNHGTCDVATGKCSCTPSFSSSDYDGGVGMWGDCGYSGPRTTIWHRAVTSG